ncbi:NnrS family protein [uncultured Tateyamaria sp.]|uniref:NnrS family protein n=1 Tax=uncultured Tateyamaria sp. TaxID=455651 RepID=UPI00261F3EAD|nr:NnrS family protein [uncultured Tateyamaria sp.]
MSTFLSYGFRPFFFLGAIWAAVAMMLWTSMLAGVISMPIRMDPVSWHAHEFLFGYLGAIIAGFLLTAVPSWTGRAPIGGLRLAFLIVVWAVGRGAFSVSDMLSPITVATIDLLFPILLAIIIAHEIVAARNWKNLIVVIALTAFVAANGLFHIEAARGDYGAGGVGLRFGVAAALMQISIIGGRVIPVFTRNWLMKTGRTNVPSKPMGYFDILALVVTAIALILWVVLPDQALSAYALLAASLLQAIRLSRWSGIATFSNSLLFVLHVGYAFIPLGAALVACSILRPDLLSTAASQHIWMSGAIGCMTLALMTRATLGHSGRELRADMGTNLLYLSVIGATAARFFAELTPMEPLVMYSAAALLWITAYSGFALLYCRMLFGDPALQSVRVK